MKIKSLFALAAMAAAGAASAAEATTANTLCRIEVASSLTNTVVSVPLKTVGGENEAIKLTDLVLTENLSEGDHLLHQKGDSWEAWMIIGGKWSTVAVSDASVTNIAGTDTELPTGDAFWLVRSKPNDSFYLYGEVAGDKTLTIPTRGSAAVYTLMGNPKLEDVDINSLPFNGTPVAGDKITIPTAGVTMGIKEYTYTTDATVEGAPCWAETVLTTKTSKTGRTRVVATTSKASVSIPAGQGFWYVSAASSN